MILHINNISKRFGSFAALTKVSFELQKGHVLAVLGPSGSGKTTLLRCIAGFERLSAGSIDYALGNGQVSIDPSTRSPVALISGRIGFVFQDIQLWPHMTVLENIIEAPMRVQKRSKEKAVANASSICERLDIAEQLHKYPTQLSIGQQQRAAIARSLAVQPEVILMDEITSSLDPEVTQKIASMIREASNSGISIIAVSHQIGFAKRIADEMVFLCKGVCEYNGPISGLNDVTSLPVNLRDFVTADLH